MRPAGVNGETPEPALIKTARLYPQPRADARETIRQCPRPPPLPSPSISDAFPERCDGPGRGTFWPGPPRAVSSSCPLPDFIRNGCRNRLGIRESSPEMPASGVAGSLTGSPNPRTITRKATLPRVRESRNVRAVATAFFQTAHPTPAVSRPTPPQSPPVTSRARPSAPGGCSYRRRATSRPGLRAPRPPGAPPR